MSWDAPITPRQMFARLVDAEKELVKLRVKIVDTEKEVSRLKRKNKVLRTQVDALCVTSHGPRC